MWTRPPALVLPLEGAGRGHSRPRHPPRVSNNPPRRCPCRSSARRWIGAVELCVGERLPHAQPCSVGRTPCNPSPTARSDLPCTQHQQQAGPHTQRQRTHLHLKLGGVQVRVVEVLDCLRGHLRRAEAQEGQLPGFPIAARSPCPPSTLVRVLDGCFRMPVWWRRREQPGMAPREHDGDARRRLSSTQHNGGAHAEARAIVGGFGRRRRNLTWCAAA